MRPKLRRDHDADAAMLAYRTGLNAALCKGWLESAVAKSAEAVKAMFDSDIDVYLVDDNSINIMRSEVEAFALARLKAQSAQTTFPRPGAGAIAALSRHRAAPSPANASL